MFEPGRESDQAFADSEFGPRLRGQPLVRGRRRMGNKALGVSKIVRNPRQLQRVECAEGGGFAALDLERDQRRSSAHLLFHERGLRMVGSPWINQARYFWML